MRRNALLVPLIIFTAIVIALFWQLTRNAQGTIRRYWSRH